MNNLIQNGKIYRKQPVKMMGVLNVTPDSFSDGGSYFSSEKAIKQAASLLAEGADIIDIGGESTRPSAIPLSLETELMRVIPVIKAVKENLISTSQAIISVDTYKPSVMLQAYEAGANMINDVKALREPGALEAARDCQVPVVLMHMQNEPMTMQNQPFYIDLLKEVETFFEERIESALRVGIKFENLILDPGFGFGKTAQHNCELLNALMKFKEKFKLPLLVGLSRKSMIGKLLGYSVEKRLYPSIGLAVYAALNGADIIRTHDVLPTRQAVEMVQACQMQING